MVRKGTIVLFVILVLEIILYMDLEEEVIVPDSFTPVQACTDWNDPEADLRIYRWNQFGQKLIPPTTNPEWGFVIKEGGEWVQIHTMPIELLASPVEVRFSKLTEYCLAANDFYFASKPPQGQPYGPIQKTWK